MIVDAHLHCWRLGRNGCSWPTPELTAIHRDFVIDDWWREAAPLHIGAGVLVQSQPSERDTGWLLGLARGDPRIAGVVGWVDLAARDAPARIAALTAHPKLRGIRPMLQDLPDDGWILSPALAPAIEALIAHGLCFDALVKPRHLPHLLRFAERHPDLPIVIDHAAKPDIAQGVLDPWRSHIAALAEFPRTGCKLSGLLTAADAVGQRLAGAESRIGLPAMVRTRECADASGRSRARRAVRRQCGEVLRTPGEGGLTACAHG